MPPRRPFPALRAALDVTQIKGVLLIAIPQYQHWKANSLGDTVPLLVGAKLAMLAEQQAVWAKMAADLEVDAEFAVPAARKWVAASVEEPEAFDAINGASATGADGGASDCEAQSLADDAEGATTAPNLGGHTPAEHSPCVLNECQSSRNRRGA